MKHFNPCLVLLKLILKFYAREENDPCPAICPFKDLTFTRIFLSIFNNNNPLKT